MKKNKLLIAIAIAACSTAVMAADEEINYSLNFKSWNHKIKSSSSSGAVNATVMSGTARKGEFFITGSMLIPTTYYFGDGSYLDRRDTDIAAGWSIRPNIALLGGAKRIASNNYDFAGTSSSLSVSKWNFNYVGINGFESIGEKSFLYGTYTRSFSGNRTKDGAKATGLAFTTYEAGLGYVLSKETQLLAGYRSQKISGDTSNPVLSGLLVGANFSF
jgi:hypothetical protein